MMKRFVTMLLVAVVMAGGLSAANIAAAAETPSVLAKYAVLHKGEDMQVCGVVGSVYYAAEEKGMPTYINLEQPYPNDPFFIIIWQEDREKFSAAFFDALSGRAITVTGPVGRAENSGKGFVTVTDPTQISIVDTVIPAEKAAQYMGRYVQIQGLLAEIKERPDQSGIPTYLNFGKAYPDHQLLGIIWEPNRAAFGDLQALKGKVIQVSGIVEEGPDGKPFVQLADGSQLYTVENSAQ